MTRASDFSRQKKIFLDMPITEDLPYRPYRRESIIQSVVFFVVLFLIVLFKYDP